LKSWSFSGQLLKDEEKLKAEEKWEAPCESWGRMSQ